MKKFYYLATALLVLAGASSCKKNADVQEPEQQSSGRMIPFTLTAGQGGQKTSMVGSTLAWTAGDKITVLKQDGTCSTELTLSDGAGSASGTFSGEISADVKDGAALYGMYKATYNAGNFSVNVPASQTYNATSFQDGIFPSIGTGTYKTDGSTSISLSNPMGILRLNLKGTAKVTQVTITTKTDNISGDFTVTSGMAVSGGSSKSITMTCSSPVQLTNDGVYFNFVVAPFAEQVVTVNVTKVGEDPVSENIQVAVTASNATKQDVSVCSPVAGTFGTASRTGGTAGWVQLWEGGPKWAVYNVGASSVGDYGGYYCWGSAKNKDTDAEYYQGEWYEEGEVFLQVDIQYGDYDTAKNLWGENWQMPTKTDFENLLDKCTTSRTTKCIIFTGKGNYACNSVVFPEAGEFSSGAVHSSDCYYWTSSYYDEYSEFESYAWRGGFDDNDVRECSRDDGFSVRAILHE